MTFRFALTLTIVAATTSTPLRAAGDGLAAYASPARRVDIGNGRRLDLRCSGDGAPTVLLEAGGRADSLAWRKVQPELARTTRVCAYDRAGYGFSDEGPMPRDIAAAARDLHALVAAAPIATPFVLVGHSMGTNIARRYATRHPADVAALVLLDPPEQDVAAFSRSWAETEKTMRAHAFEFAKACEQAAAKGALAAPGGSLASCIHAGDPTFPDVLDAAIHAQKERPAFWHTMISEWQANDAELARPVAAGESHGSMPLIVLTASDTFAGVAPADLKALEAARDRTQAAIAATSSRGERRRVEHSGHDIELDRPDAVVAAVRDAIAMTRPR